MLLIREVWNFTTHTKQADLRPRGRSPVVHAAYTASETFLVAVHVDCVVYVWDAIEYDPRCRHPSRMGPSFQVFCCCSLG